MPKHSPDYSSSPNNPQGKQSPYSGWLKTQRKIKRSKPRTPYSTSRYDAPTTGPSYSPMEELSIEKKVDEVKSILGSVAPYSKRSGLPQHVLKENATFKRPDLPNNRGASNDGRHLFPNAALTQDVVRFLKKNKNKPFGDVLSGFMNEFLCASSDPFANEIFAAIQTERGKMMKKIQLSPPEKHEKKRRRYHQDQVELLKDAIAFHLIEANCQRYATFPNRTNSESLMKEAGRVQTSLNNIARQVLHPEEFAKKVLQMVDYSPLKKGQSFKRNKSIFKSDNPHKLTLKKRETINDLISNLGTKEQMTGVFNEVVTNSLQTLSHQFDKIPDEKREAYVKAFIGHLAKNFASKWPEGKIKGIRKKDLPEALEKSVYPTIPQHYYRKEYPIGYEEAEDPRNYEEDDDPIHYGEDEEEDAMDDGMGPTNDEYGEEEEEEEEEKDEYGYGNYLINYETLMLSADNWPTSTQVDTPYCAQFQPPPPPTPPKPNNQQPEPMWLRPPFLNSPGYQEVFPYPRVREKMERQWEQQQLKQKLHQKSLRQKIYEASDTQANRNSKYNQQPGTT